MIEKDAQNDLSERTEKVQRRGQHTPGPWTLQYMDDTYSYQAYLRVQYGKNPIASVGAGLPYNEQQMHANARLIAAAPDLLNALKEMDELVEKLWESVPWGKTFMTGDTIQRLNEVPMIAKRAIAKATIPDTQEVQQ